MNATEAKSPESPGTSMPDPSKSMIAAEGLTKHYGKFIAVSDVTFSVPQGEVVAFLGPNGAGKSTTMKMLTGFLAPTRGHASIGGFDVFENRQEAVQILGYLPENGPLYMEMTPKSLLYYCARLRGLSREFTESRIEYVVDRCSLGTVWEKPIGKLSKGFRQRVGMAQAILHDPAVLILDEPTSGLDPNQTHQVRDLIRSLAKSKTILLSTHILSEVRAMCGRIILVNNGRVILDGPVSALSDDIAGMEKKFQELTA